MSQDGKVRSAAEVLAFADVTIEDILAAFKQEGRDNGPPHPAVSVSVCVCVCVCVCVSVRVCV